MHITCEFMRAAVPSLIASPHLRTYQIDVVEEFERTIATGKRRIILVSPTGSGKTVIASAIVSARVDAGKRVLVLAHRREIVLQTSDKLQANGIDHGIIMAGWGYEPQQVQVASVQTLHARAIRNDRLALPTADLVIVDECHHATARTWRTIIDAYPEAVLLGLTATPCRGDGRGLGGIFEAMIECPQVQELVDDGFLVPTRHYAPTDPDLTGVRVQVGDYNETQLADVMDRTKLVGDIVTHWHRLAEERRTVVFATGVQHSLHIRDEFIKSGVKAAHIDGSTPKDERDEILRKLERGEIEVVCNCMVLTEGFDCPDIGCIVLARPTKKMGLYRQMIGRGLRPAAGKADVIVIDHSGAVYRHGFAEDQVEWTLSPDKHAENPTHEKRGVHGTRSRLVDCTRCGALRVAGEKCRHCGFKPAPPPMHVPTVDADLALATRGNGTTGRSWSPAEREQWHGMLASIARERGYKPTWASVNYKEKFGAWPAWGASPDPIVPTAECRSWVRSRMIAFAKRRPAA